MLTRARSLAHVHSETQRNTHALSLTCTLFLSRWGLPANWIALGSLAIESLQLALFCVQPTDEETLSATPGDAPPFGGGFFDDVSSFFYINVKSLMDTEAAQLANTWGAVAVSCVLIMVFVGRFFVEVSSFQRIDK